MFVTQSTALVRNPVHCPTRIVRLQVKKPRSNNGGTILKVTQAGVGVAGREGAARDAQHAAPSGSRLALRKVSGRIDDLGRPLMVKPGRRCG